MIREFEKTPNTADGGGSGAGTRPISSWLPAGAYAEAVVLAGVDASAGVSSQGDPRPVLLRLTGKARSAAAGGAAMEADVEGCTLTGAAYGDLSSEKVYVRLQTMTCSGSDAGTVIETKVSGFVAGGGKAGVRGPVVSREGELVEKAFLAGLVSGVGETAANVLQAPAGTAGAENAASLSDLGRAGLGAGAGSAGRRVADYLIRRAEQYQPVIQLQTGTRVTVVFIEGARIAERRQEEQQPREEQMRTNTHLIDRKIPFADGAFGRPATHGLRGREPRGRELAVPHRAGDGVRERFGGGPRGSSAGRIAGKDSLLPGSFHENHRDLVPERYPRLVRGTLFARRRRCGGGHGRAADRSTVGERDSGRAE